MPSPPIGIPALSGLCGYPDAARVGLSVEDNVRRLLRYHWVERRLMQIAIARLTATPEWEVKCAFALHQWQDAEHAQLLRDRIGEMRHPVPSLDAAPDDALERFLGELARASTTAELVAGLYLVAHTRLAATYRQHLAATNPVADQPTHRLLRIALAEEDDAIAWGRQAMDGLAAANADGSVSRWTEWLAALLDAAGGISGTEPVRQGALPPRPRTAAPSDAPPFFPRRDERFVGQLNFAFPPHVVYAMPGVPADERNLALLCKRALEMDVPEMMASFLTERPDQPWEFYRDYSRQLWDEMRHAMLGTAALEARGVDWTRIPLNVSFALRLNLHATPLERQVILYAIEQSLMPGDTGKRAEWETAIQAGDSLSAHLHDYDWADEVLHTQIGRRQLRREGITPREALERARAIHDRTWAALDGYRHLEPQSAWWADFVRLVLGHDSAAGDVDLGEVRVISE
jgi:hypothetical protein